jgi:hypothetical protein
LIAVALGRVFALYSSWYQLSRLNSTMIYYICDVQVTAIVTDSIMIYSSAPVTFLGGGGGGFRAACVGAIGA